ncbi:SPOR domain-containing protein [Luteibaculum oceani]|uniref:SPOR domain-containing protein n=1 Tax=Luteibaculum oceani TaxID=1294296 RepID=A0A5C6VIW0_9FLAO|nr:SPOR domain-containing protein [Luteibaculum oceani]TXC85077.1 SPOR domain-containing protein [Luteibaculum oceani]
MAIRILSILVFAVGFSFSSWGQSPVQKRWTIDDAIGSKYQPMTGNVQLIIEPSVSSLIERFQSSKAADPRIDGYRVQLYFGTREKATETKTEFLKKFPTVKSYITWLEPNFRVRVGNFRTQLEAESFLQRIKRYFPTAYVVSERIDLPDIK